MKPSTFFLVSLGCAKNRVDSEVICGALAAAGYQQQKEPSRAEIIVVNTCAFIESAVQESVDTILDLVRAKEQGSCRVLVVTGCLPQRYGRKLARSLPEVDILVGVSSFHHLVSLLNDHQPGTPQKVFLEPPRFLMSSLSPRVLSAPWYSAYLKIAEGCSHRCTFCTIPAIRGSYRSRVLEDVLREAEWLAEQGVKEVNLVAQDTTAYGEDLGFGPGLAGLLHALGSSGWFSWIRILYGHPRKIDSRLLGAMRSHPCICPYLDVPFQHASPPVLRAMGRQGSASEFQELVDSIREQLPGISLRTTVMVGFPGETEKDFQELHRFVDRVRFQRLGIFAYSSEKGTAAARLGDPIPEEVKQERLQTIARLQESISLQHHLRLTGTVQPVLVEGRSTETDLLLEGRLPSQAPDVDGRVLINRGFAEVGQIVPLLITEAHPHDLVGEIVYSELF